MKEDLNHRQQQARPYTHVEFSRIVRSALLNRENVRNLPRNGIQRIENDYVSTRRRGGEKKKKKKIRKFG